MKKSATSSDTYSPQTLKTAPLFSNSTQFYKNGTKSSISSSTRTPSSLREPTTTEAGTKLPRAGICPRAQFWGCLRNWSRSKRQRRGSRLCRCDRIMMRLLGSRCRGRRWMRRSGTGISRRRLKLRIRLNGVLRVQSRKWKLRFRISLILILRVNLLSRNLMLLILGILHRRNLGVCLSLMRLISRLRSQRSWNLLFLRSISLRIMGFREWMGIWMGF